MKIPKNINNKILVVGDIMLDRYWFGSTERISPEAPVPVVSITDIVDRPGGAANVAVNVASLGGNVSLLGVAGYDTEADIIEKLCNDNSVQVGLVKSYLIKTATKLRVISRHQQIVRLDVEAEHGDVLSEELYERYCKEVNCCDVVILSDYAKGALADIEQLISYARGLGKIVLVDPKGKDFHRYAGATMITPNEAEFEAVVGLCVGEDVLIEKGLQLVSKLEVKSLLVTRSEKGVILINNDGGFLVEAAKARDVYDVTGAGDTIIAALGVCLAGGMSMEQSVRLANVAAGIVVGKLGASTVTATEIEEELLRGNDDSSRVMGQEEALEYLRRLKNLGYRIVFSNGCFDILHSGHVNYLKNARKLGDFLVVAVNDDSSVRRLKGRSRPINSLSARMEILAALHAVDLVFPFYEDTPMTLIRKICPDVLVKGGDYAIEDVVGSEFVLEYGGEVIIEPFIAGISSTQLINKIKNSLDKTTGES